MGAVWPDIFVSRLHDVIEKCNHNLMAGMHTECIRLWSPTSSTTPSACAFSVDSWVLHWFWDYKELYQFTAKILLVYGISMTGVCTVIADFLTSLKPMDERLKGFAFSEVELFIVYYNVIHFILDYLSEAHQIQIPGLETVLKHLRTRLPSSEKNFV